MIPVNDARDRLLANAPRMPVEERPLMDALLHHAAADIIAPHDHPLFDMSAMDGYAFAFDPAVTAWRVVGAVAAGDTFPRALARGECVRIFTGAMLPPGADTVVMQERTRVEGGMMGHTDDRLRAGGNVRRRGEQLQRGDLVVPAGALLGASTVGLLASVGVATVKVHRRPRVGVLLTGGEFAADREPGPGRIFDSNGVMLATALQADGIVPALMHAPDAQEQLDAALVRLAATCDVVVSTGGASVGDHDRMRTVVERAGGTIHFHGVAQKPGKPMLFATVHGVPLLALPGNPRAAMVLHWVYGRPFLRRMQGAVPDGPPVDRLPLAGAVRTKGGRTEFRAARVQDGRVHPLPDEGSHMLRSLTQADALMVLHAPRQEWAAGHVVEVVRIALMPDIAP